MPATVPVIRFQSRAWPAPTGERDARDCGFCQVSVAGMARSYGGAGARDCSSADQKFIFSFAPAQRGGPNTWMVYLPKDEMSYE